MIVQQRTGEAITTHVVPKPGSYCWIGFLLHVTRSRELYLGSAMTN